MDTEGCSCPSKTGGAKKEKNKKNVLKVRRRLSGASRVPRHPPLWALDQREGRQGTGSPSCHTHRKRRRSYPSGADLGGGLMRRAPTLLPGQRANAAIGSWFLPRDLKCNPGRLARWPRSKSAVPFLCLVLLPESGECRLFSTCLPHFQ
jgi:hypothetical protein